MAIHAGLVDAVTNSPLSGALTLVVPLAMLLAVGVWALWARGHGR